MDTQKSTYRSQEPVESHAEINIEKICSDSSISTQALLQSALWDVFNRITNTFERLGIARGKLGLAAIQFGFNSANKTATAGLFQLGGGVVLGGTGVAQGVTGCKRATELSQAVETRKSNLADINKNILREGGALSLEGSDITVQVEALDEQVTPGLDEIEEEIFYDAEETLSFKRTKPEEQTETQMSEKAADQGKITEKKAEELIKKENKAYGVKKDLIEAKKDTFQAIGGIGQASYYISQGLGELEKTKSQKATIEKEVAQDNQNQLVNTIEDLKKKADKISDFDPFQRNSSSLRG